MPRSDEQPPAEPPAAVLVEEATKKAGLLWLSRLGEHAGRPQPVWFVWHDGAAYVLSGGAEQPVPDIGGRALVQVRSKDKGGRLLTWVADVDDVEPDSEQWRAVVPVLQAGRLNTRDGDAAPARWARESVVTRLTPTGELVEQPGRLPDTGEYASPPPTPATTPVPRPFVFGRRRR